MPTIRFPNQPDVQRATYQGAAPADQSAKFRGTAALAQGIGQAGGVLQEFALRSAEVKNTGDMAKAKLAMQKADAEIQTDLAANADFTTWEQAAGKRVQEAQQAVFETKDGLAPEVRRRLEQDFAAFSESTTTQVKYQALRARNADNDRALATLASQSYTSGDIEGGDQMIDERARLGLITPNAATLQKSAGRQDADKASVNSGITNDPIATVEALKEKDAAGNFKQWTNLDPNTRQALAIEARTQVSRVREDTMRGLAEEIADGQYVSDTRLKSLVDEKRLTANESKNIMLSQTRAGLNKDANVGFAAALDAASRYDPNKDRTRERRVEILGSMAGLPKEWTDEVDRVLRQRSTPTGEGARTAVASSHLSRMFEANLLGNRKDDPIGSSTAYVDAQLQFKAWAQDHQDASPEEQVQFINTLLKDKATDQTPLANALFGVGG